MTYIFRSRPLATRQVTHGEEPHVHTHFMCPTCGEQWAEITHSGSEKNKPCCHDFVMRYCDKHLPGWPQAIAGSFLDLFTYPDCYLGVPKEVLTHDFLMYMTSREDLRGKETPRGS